MCHGGSVFVEQAAAEAGLQLGIRLMEDERHGLSALPWNFNL
jgi:hypothetical protein